MIENRPIVNIVIGYIIGILMGLYFRISIVLLYLIIVLILYLYPKSIKKTKFKLISIRRYFRYVKIIFIKKVLIIIFITSIISNTITLFQNSKFNNLYQNLENQELIIKAEIVSNKKQKQYKEVYKIKVENINGNKKYKNTYLYLNTKQEINLEYGNKIIFKGEYKEPAKRTNYKGFDYKEYLKTLKINGTAQLDEILQIHSPSKTIFKLSNDIALKIKEKIQNNFSEETGNLLLGLTIGDVENLDEQIKENFKNCNLLHILSISGMHIAYIIIFTNFVFIKILGKRIGKIITFFIITIYMFITGMPPPVVRAGIMGIILILSTIFYRKSDIWQNISLSLLILLIYNPFLIKSISVLLSYGGTIGIIIFQKNIKSVTLSASLFIMPILALSFNQIPLISLITSVLAGFIITPVIILGFVFIVFIWLLYLFKIFFIKNIYVQILEFGLKLIIDIADMGGNIPFNNVYVTTPNIFEIIIYYGILLFRKFFVFNISQK